MSNGKTLPMLLNQIRSFSTTQLNRNLVHAPIQLFGLEGRYAHAIYSAASKENQLDAVSKDFQYLTDLFIANKGLNELLKNPTLTKEQKQNAVNELAVKRNASAVTVNTLNLLAENGRLNRLGGVATAFGKLMSAHRGEVSATVTSAKPLDAKEVKELQAVLQQFAKKGSKLTVDMKINPEILGGLIIEIGDRYVDMSIAAKVKAYSDLLRQETV